MVYPGRIWPRFNCGNHCPALNHPQKQAGELSDLSQSGYFSNDGYKKRPWLHYVYETTYKRGPHDGGRGRITRV